MSFASDVKKEIIASEFTDESLKAELYGILKLKAEIQISQMQLRLVIKTTSLSLSRRIIMILKKLYSVSVELLSKTRSNLDKKKVYYINIDSKIKEILSDLDIMDDDYNFKDEISNIYDENYDSVLRGMFLAKGSVNDPLTSTYHLEVSCNDESEVDYMINMLIPLGINGKKSFRRGYHIFYLKKGEEIGDFLKVIGATNTLFSFEDVRIQKDINSSINRVTNCDIANGTKALETSDKQMEWIRTIKKYKGFDNLSVRLIEAITLRVKNEGSSLQELSDISEEQIGRYVSKSALAHCMKDLEILAKTLINENSKTHKDK